MVLLTLAAPPTRVLVVLCACLSWMASGCRSAEGSIGGVYAELEAEVAAADPLEGPEPGVREARVRRADRARALASAGELTSAEDWFEAAMILVDTDRAEDHALAIAFAGKSAELGDPRARRVQAEAVDKSLVAAAKPQKYGTQYVFEWVLDSWRLHPVDVATSDAERAAMGVPAYADLLLLEDEMNRAHGKRPRPR